ncbi:UDP-3-O-(3-hydroxymyristoyl)glucosamine N-acyltransferase [Sedimentisphaera salicampi]|uniref:UDP-3-O-(3-hydroxymyristoyl)glucosamine N-acyltransferase n=1 Tax=Sedimentisphaera salicampi TaxID=1941349 RepID=UPI000B9C9215|nr:UDP-3-O-(3-hydroxymyristoyl)glucosamine N-acyltransferase [Sedimentisphaera salicampi]OXU15057.1 UDP-3-O-acylglucosamine N-acyltransferase [Sedimentisphaera salicampi]
MQKYTVKQLADKFGCEVKGDPETVIHTAAPIQEAGEGAVTFLSNRKYFKFLKDTKADAVILDQEAETSAKALLICSSPYYAFCRIVEFMFGHRKHREPSISEKAFISDSAEIGHGCTIYENVFIDENASVGDGCVLYPGAFIGRDTKLGDGCILYPNAVVFEDCRIGSRVILQSNCSIGQDGFGFAENDGFHHKIPHIKSVVLGDDVEIGANAAVERGSMRDTLIGDCAKIGDCVVIGHGARIGRGCMLVPQVGIAGTAELGQYCLLGGQSAVVGHIKVGNQVMVGGKSAVMNDIPDGKRVIGQPAMDENEAKRMYVSFPKVPEMRKQIRQLEKRIKALEAGREE